jgi:hypothetical protein
VSLILPLLIGQAPGPNTDPTLPLFPVPSTSAGGRLASFMGLTRGEYLVSFDRINLLQDFPGKTGRDDKFPMTKAKIAAAAIKPLLRDRVVILVGRNVANAFGLEAEFHSWVEGLHYCRLMAVVPHPSGRNHWYNKQEHKQIAQDFWHSCVAQHVPDKSLLPSVISRRNDLLALQRARQELETNDNRDIPGHPVH